MGMSITLQDYATRKGVDGNVQHIIKTLTQANGLTDNLKFVECNSGTSHLSTIETGLPEAYWRLLNQGVPTSKDTTKQITDSCAMLEVYAPIDKKLVDIQGDNKADYMLAKESRFLRGLSNQLERNFWYGSSVNPASFIGLTARFNTLNNSVESSENIIDAGGVGDDNCSIWLVGFGDEAVHGIHPKNLPAGFQRSYLGEQTLKDAKGGSYQGLNTHFSWDVGLCVANWRHCIRLANIDMAKVKSGEIDLTELMIEVSERIPLDTVGTTYKWFGNRDVRTALRQQIRKDKNVNLTWETVAGKRILAFDEFEFVRSDALLRNEARVVA